MSDIQKVSIALTGEQITVLKAAVQTGEYATTSEAIREALRDWQWKRQLRGDELSRLQASWDKGKASGKPVTLDLAKMRKEARKRLAELKTSSV